MRFLLRVTVHGSMTPRSLAQSIKTLEEAMWLAPDAPPRDTHRFVLARLDVVDHEDQDAVELTGELLPRQLDGHSAIANILADAFEEFGKMPEGKDMPGNAITLWKAMNHGWTRVSAMLRTYREN